MPKTLTNHELMVIGLVSLVRLEHLDEELQEMLKTDDAMNDGLDYLIDMMDSNNVDAQEYHEHILRCVKEGLTKISNS